MNPELNYRAIFENEPECVKLLAADGSLLEMNPAGLRMIEADSLARVQNQCVYPLVVEAHRAAFRALTERVFHGESGALEFQIIGLRGGRRWLETHATPLRDAAGRVTALLGITRDITARKEAEAELRQAESTLRSIMESSTDAILLLDREATIRFINRPAPGVKVEDVVGTSIFSHVAEAFRPAMRACFHRVLSTGEPDGYQTDYTTPAGVVLAYEARVTAVRSGEQIIGLAVVARDITARREAEAALRESEERLRLALDAAHMGTFDWDIPRGRIAWSRWHEELWGFRPGEFAGTYEAFASRVHPDDLPGLNAEVQRCIAARESWAREFRVIWPDGGVHWITGEGEFTFDAAGRPLRMRGVVGEITARKQTEARVAQLSRLYATLSQVNQVIVRVKSREELFPAICRAAVENGGFAQGCVRLLDRATLTVTTVAIFGPGAEKLAGLQFDLKDARFKDGLMARALATGQMAYTSDVQRDPALGYWHESAKACGLHAVAVVPFRCGGAIAGLLVLSSPTTDYFAEPGLQSLVTEMAADISYALDALEADAQRRRAEQAETHARAFADAAILSLPGIFYLIGAEGRFIRWNKNFETVSGYTGEEIARLHPTDLFVGEEKELIRQRIGRVFAEGEADAEAHFTAKDGTRTPYYFTGRRLLLEGQPHLVGMGVDLTARRQAEKSLQDLAHAITRAGDAVFLTDREGIITQVNPRFTTLYGYTAEKVVGKVTPRILKSGKHPPEFYQAAWATLLRGETIHGELVNRAKDGRLVEIEETITSFRDDRGEIAGFMAVQREIGARKRAERRSAVFADLGQRLNTARTARAAAEVILHTADTLLGWDACLLYMYSPERDRVRPLLEMDVFDGQRRECTAAAGEYPVGHYSRRALQEGAILTLRQEPLTKPADQASYGGSERPAASLMHVPIREGERPIGTLSIQSYRLDAYTEADLTTLQSLADHCAGALRRIDEEESRHRAETALRESEARFRTLIEHASDLITVITPEGVIRFQSPSSERLLGYRPEEMTARPAFERIHPEDAPQVTAAIQRALAQSGVPASVEYRFHHKDGSWRTLESVGRSIVDSTGENVIAVNSRDVTEHRKLEEQLRQSQKMDAIGQLAGGVAHDFNNILAAITMQTELLRMEEGLTATAHDGLQEIRVATERAANLTRQLLLFSRKQVVQSRDLDLNEVVASLARMLQRIIGEDVRLQLHLHPTPLRTRADAGMLDQVLMNLAVNARDAMPKGGTLRLETATQVLTEAAAARHPDATPGDYVRLQVTDTGCGIPPEVLPRIFEPFFTTKEPGKGTGLGLATVFGIVQQHGGWIDVQSEAGQGTRFLIHLPALPAADATVTSEATSPTPRGGTETILLVEDDPAVRKLTLATLKRHGYQVVEAGSGAAALRVWPEVRERVALLLTDLVMPDGVSGHELAQQLRADRAGLKVIYMSGYSADLAGRKLALSPSENFLQKPFPRDALLGAVRRCLDA